MEETRDSGTGKAVIGNVDPLLYRGAVVICSLWIRAVTVLDRDRSNSPERRTRTEVFFLFRTLVLKLGKNTENLAFSLSKLI